MPTTKSSKSAKSTSDSKASSRPDAPKEVEARTFRKTRVGTVVSDKMTKTVVVRVDRFVRHPLYPRRIKQSNRFSAHHEGQAKLGDVVRIMETRPLSKTKRWRVVDVIQQAG